MFCALSPHYIVTLCGGSIYIIIVYALWASLICIHSDSSCHNAVGIVMPSLVWTGTLLSINLSLHGNCMQLYVCLVFCFVVLTSHMFLICFPLIMFSLCRRNAKHHYAMSVLISTKHSPRVLIFRNVTRYLTITELISTKHLSAVPIMNHLSIDVVNFTSIATYCQTKHG